MIIIDNSSLLTTKQRALLKQNACEIFFWVSSGLLTTFVIEHLETITLKTSRCTGNRNEI